MSATLATDQIAAPATKTPPRYLGLRISGWAVALALGAAQAWATRFTMNPDGVSYLDIGDAYWRGDWRNAINAYWSPLYSWILGFFLKVFKPSMYWQYPVVHLINFLIYIFALASFEYFLMNAVVSLRADDSKLSEGWWRALGYSMFISTSLVYVGIYLVSPDMLVIAFTYLIAGIALEIYRSSSTRMLIALGFALGLGYLAKTIVLPIGFVCLLTLAVFLRNRWRALLIPSLIMLCIAGPYVGLCSKVKRRFTIGESGRWNYLVFVNGVQPFFPPGQHTRRMIEHPSTYDFHGTLEGTYPPWKDPSYWQEGITPRWNSQAMLKRIKLAVFMYLLSLLHPLLNLNLTIGFWIFALLGSRLSLRLESLLLLVPCFAALAAYAPLLVEYRYVAPFLCILWMTLFLGFSSDASKWVRITVTFLVVSNLASAVWSIENLKRLNLKSSAVVEAALILRECGLNPGDEVGLISTEEWMSTGAQGSFIPRMAKLRIISETTDPDQYWRGDDRVRVAVLGAMRSVGAKGVLLRDRPKLPDPAWLKLGESGYYYRPL